MEHELDKKKRKEEKKIKQKKRKTTNENMVFTKEVQDLQTVRCNVRQENNKRRKEKRKNSKIPKIKITQNDVLQNMVIDRNKIQQTAVQDIRNNITQELISKPKLQDVKSASDIICADVYQVKIIRRPVGKPIIKGSLIPVIGSYALQNRKWIKLMVKKKIQICTRDDYHGRCV